MKETERVRESETSEHLGDVSSTGWSKTVNDVSVAGGARIMELRIDTYNISNTSC